MWIFRRTALTAGATPGSSGYRVFSPLLRKDAFARRRVTRRVVHVVDDDDAMRDSLVFILEVDGTYVAEPHVSGVAFLDRLDDLAEGCVLLDIQMPGLDGMAVQQNLNARGSGMPVIMLTGFAEVGQAVQAMKAGARDFIEKPFDPVMLLAAIAAVWTPKPRLFDQDAVVLQARERVSRLSPRERDVLGALLDGHANKMIAWRLGLSPRTVEIHRANMMHRLDVRSLSEAVRIGLAAGLDSASGDARHSV